MCVRSYLQLKLVCLLIIIVLCGAIKRVIYRAKKTIWFCTLMHVPCPLTSTIRLWPAYSCRAGQQQLLNNGEGKNYLSNLKF
jgi:hypothetical protein